MHPMSPAEPDLRASDAERERTVAQLRDHFSAGRISEQELDERSDAAYAARTVGELGPLLADLPALPATPARRGHDAAHEAAKRRVLQNAGSAALISLVCVVIWVASGASAGFWPIWVMLGVGIRVAFVAWDQLGPAADERRRLGQGSASRPGADRSPRR
jgi:uncharacterized membrane protein YccC